MVSLKDLGQYKEMYTKYKQLEGKREGYSSWKYINDSG